MYGAVSSPEKYQQMSNQAYQKKKNEQMLFKTQL